MSSNIPCMNQQDGSMTHDFQLYVIVLRGFIMFTTK